MEFYTATINNWQKLLEDDNYKRIVIDSLSWLVKENRCYVHGFVIMPNHIHLLWTGTEEYSNEINSNSLLSFTGYEFRKQLLDTSPEVLKTYKSTQADREYHFWERNNYPMKIKDREDAYTRLRYIHNNPLQEKWKLVELPEQYYYSSAAFYELGKSDFNFLSSYLEF